MRWRNVSPLGDLDVVGVGLIKFGDEFDAPDELTFGLGNQPDNFEPLDAVSAPADPEEIAE
jgi:hypothetical protein